MVVRDMTVKSIKNIRQEFKENGVFYTPHELAKELLQYLDFKPKRVYDPTCGQGNLLSVFEDDVQKFGQELFQDELEKAEQRLTNFYGYCGDTLKDDGFADEKFDCIIANPPFSIAWEQNPNDKRFNVAPALAPKSKADWAFMLHMLYHLEDNGVCIALEFPGILYRGNAEYKIRRWFVENNYIDKVVLIPGNTFEDTTISTIVLVIRKNKETTNITFINKEENVEKEVLLDEVVEQDFNLSPSVYAYKEKPKEVVDVLELNNKARQNCLDYLEKEILFDKKVCELEKWDTHKEFLDKLKELIEKSY